MADSVCSPHDCSGVTMGRYQTDAVVPLTMCALAALVLLSSICCADQPAAKPGAKADTPAAGKTNSLASAKQVPSQPAPPVAVAKPAQPVSASQPGKPQTAAIPPVPL